MFEIDKFEEKLKETFAIYLNVPSFVDDFNFQAEMIIRKKWEVRWALKREEKVIEIRNKIKLIHIKKSNPSNGLFPAYLCCICY